MTNAPVRQKLRVAILRFVVPSPRRASIRKPRVAAPSLTLFGEHRDTTVIRLDDNLLSFAAGSRRPLLDLFNISAGWTNDTSLLIYGNRRPGVSGIDELPEVIGAAAVDLLTSCVQRGEKGMPAHPKRVLVAGRYMPGGTLLSAPRDA